MATWIFNWSKLDLRNAIKSSLHPTKFILILIIIINQYYIFIQTLYPTEDLLTEKFFSVKWNFITRTYIEFVTCHSYFKNSTNFFKIIKPIFMDNWNNSYGFWKINKFVWNKKDKLPYYTITVRLLLCKINVLDIFNFFDFFQDFLCVAKY